MHKKYMITQIIINMMSWGFVLIHSVIKDMQSGDTKSTEWLKQW